MNATASNVSADTSAGPVPASVTAALARPVPAFLQTVVGRPRTSADVVLRTDRWQDAAGVEALVRRLSALVCSPGAAALFGDGDEAPRGFYGPPRLGTRPASPADPEADAPGVVGYVCALTGEPFELAAGAPVPALRFAAVDGAGDVTQDVHPSLAQAGPAHVLWAAWSGLEADLARLVMGLADVVDLAAALAGVEPEDLRGDATAGGNGESVAR